MEKLLKVNITSSVAVVQMNNEKSLNALSYDMLEELYNVFSGLDKDPSISFIILKGSDRAFCAGGDLKEIYGALNSDNPMSASKYFAHEFRTDALLHSLNTPVLSFWHGISMGGGIGLSISSPFKLVDETTHWAMPETRLGMFPDVGMGYYFSRMEKPFALYLSLLGTSIYAGDIVNLNLATHLIHSEDFSKIEEDIIKICSMDKSKDEILSSVSDVLDSYNVEEIKPTLDRNNIALHFNKDNLMDIFESLDRSKDKWAKDTLEDLNKKCPTSLQLVFLKYEAGKYLTREEHFDLDLKLMEYCIASKNMKEGIRSIIIDKDNVPNFFPKSIGDMTLEHIQPITEIFDSYTKKTSDN